MIVKDLSKSYNPVPKIQKKTVEKPTEMKKKSSKLAKLERNRFSIVTKKLDICYICEQAKKEDYHEIFEGKNRQISMKYGLVIPICRKCHKKVTNDVTLQEKLHKVGQEVFKNYYKSENFMQIFGKNYL